MKRDITAVRALPAVDRTSISIQHLTDRMAACYPDEERRDWIRREMGRWAEGYLERWEG
jgi:hypothetical protein